MRLPFVATMHKMREGIAYLSKRNWSSCGSLLDEQFFVAESLQNKIAACQSRIETDGTQL